MDTNLDIKTTRVKFVIELMWLFKTSPSRLVLHLALVCVFSFALSVAEENTCSLDTECVELMKTIVDARVKEMEYEIENRVWNRIMDAPIAATDTVLSDVEPVVPDCDFEYVGKCFKFHFADVMSFAEARRQCERSGGHMANLYDRAHDDMIVDAVRKREHANFFLFIGMTYDLASDEVKWHNGTTSSYTRWYPQSNFPQKTHGLIRLIVLPFATGMLNNIGIDDANANGVLCETPQVVE